MRDWLKALREDAEEFTEHDKQESMFEVSAMKPLLDTGSGYVPDRFTDAALDAGFQFRPAAAKKPSALWELAKCWDVGHNASRMVAVTGRSGEGVVCW